ncbi:MAG: SusC/RagA family TonB-linked outer membrane protein [Muribaculaceae bacterium]|nr:SusC/RagA family TonB-linked outer membrane protein [Muribaculaceae bacterium]
MKKLFLIIMSVIACTLGANAQTHTYSGTILDQADGEPLIGATIMPIGGGQGAAADYDGKFTITVPANVKEANISYVGYTTKKVKLEDNATYYLSSSATNLDDVVVVAYGTASKESLTGSIAVVGSKEIEDRPVTTVTQALEGNAPGVQVNNSTGTPGSAPSIRIRGFNSINGDNSPLYVVDGIPFEGSISDLNPADIESMSVLKDAASCALYGNRGANGVILITTKRAKKSGHVDVTVSIREGAYTRGLPFYDKVGPNDWMQLNFDAQVNGDAWTMWNNAQISGSSLTYEDAYSTYLSVYRGNFISLYAHNNIYGVDDKELFDETGRFVGGNPLPGYTDLDWWKAVSRTGYRQEYNINATGATDKFNVFASVSYLKENGYMLGTDFERFTGRVNANFQPVSFFKFGVNLNANQQNSEQGNVEEGVLNTINNPFAAMYLAPIYPYYAHNADGSIRYDANGQPVWNTASYLQSQNVAWEMRLNQHDFNRTALDGTIYGTAIIPYGFELTFRGSLVRYKYTYGEYFTNQVGSQQGTGMLSDSFVNYNSHTFMQTLTWTHDYGLNHIDVLLDHENYESSNHSYYVQKSNQILEDQIMLDNFSLLEYGNEGMARVRAESYLGRVRYDYNQQYFGEFSIRRDGSSKFAKNNRWGTFWSVGASWIISREKFMQDVNWINYLKLRAAYGSVGNDASAPTYSYYNTYDFNTYAGVANIYPYGLGVNNLKWEATKTFDIAVEGSLFNDRFNFSIGYFNKRNSDLLFAYVLPLSYGLNSSGSNSSIWQNIGEMENQGLEIQFGVDIIRNRDFYWNFKIDATWLKNTVKKLPNGNDLPSQNLYIGKSLYRMMAPTWAGVEQATGQSVYEISPDGWEFIGTNDDGSTYYNEQLFNTYVAGAEASQADGFIFMEKDGKYYTSNTMYATNQFHGSALPDVYGSFGTNLSWKGINFGLLFTYSLGGKTQDSNYQQLMTIGIAAPGANHKDLLKSWTHAPEGVTLDNNYIDPKGVPQLNSQRSQYNNMYSSRFLVSSSYLSLKNINISYDLPQKWVDAIKLQGINIGFTCDDVFLVTKRKGMNPTYGWTGGQGQYYVPSRVFTFLLNVKF